MIFARVQYRTYPGVTHIEGELVAHTGGRVILHVERNDGKVATVSIGEHHVISVEEWYAPDPDRAGQLTRPPETYLPEPYLPETYRRESPDPSDEHGPFDKGGLKGGWMTRPGWLK